MSIVTFWSNGKEQTGKTLAVAAIGTHMAIEHNYKILIISTGYQDKTLDNCFWKQVTRKKNRGLFGPNTNIGLEDGITGMIKAMRSNKLEPEDIKNYTKVVLKDRLEVLQSFKGNATEYEELKKSYSEIITIANSYYDLILVDLDKELGNDIEEIILNKSNVIVANIGQRLSSINEFIKIREEKPILKSKKTIISIGRYDKFSKYNTKNISRYLNEKNQVIAIPYNTLFFEAAEEADVVDLFFKMKKVIDSEDRNVIFLSEVKRADDNIIYRIQDLAMKM